MQWLNAACLLGSGMSALGRESMGTGMANPMVWPFPIHVEARVMSNPQQPFSASLAALAGAITGLAPGLQSIAANATSARSMAQSAQDTADAAIPKSRAGTATGDYRARRKR
ncbi:hypothetical protein [Burkholderia sp. F1]|uniref:hypothetical protein n=1 Tax=Burkholderia sp. F1 TaxID=3366817 RepID=UPI003D753321